MKISDVVYTTMDELAKMPRFDINEPPRKAKWYLQVVAWILSFPETYVTRSKIKKVNMKKGMKIEIVKNHPFRVMTTKKLYDGEYEIDIQINGLEFSNAKFYITV